MPRSSSTGREGGSFRGHPVRHTEQPPQIAGEGGHARALRSEALHVLRPCRGFSEFSVLLVTRVETRGYIPTRLRRSRSRSPAGVASVVTTTTAQVDPHPKPKEVPGTTPAPPPGRNSVTCSLCTRRKKRAAKASTSRLTGCTVPSIVGLFASGRTTKERAKHDLDRHSQRTSDHPKEDPRGDGSPSRRSRVVSGAGRRDRSQAGGPAGCTAPPVESTGMSISSTRTTGSPAGPVTTPVTVPVRICTSCTAPSRASWTAVTT